MGETVLRSALAYVEPDKRSYSNQKNIRLLPSSAEDTLVPCSTDHIEDLGAVFGQRLSLLKQGQATAEAVLYPGLYVPSLGPNEDLVSCGDFFFQRFERFRGFGWFENVDITLVQEPIHRSGAWVWRNIPQPRLRLLRVEATHSVSRSCHASFDAYSRSNLPSKLLSNLHLNLKKIRALWEPGCEGSYSDEALSACFAFAHALSALPSELSEPVLFELEALASLASPPQELRPALVGRFFGHWLTIHHTSIAQLKPTELCETDRLLDELESLAAFRFAPIVVNEYLTVADGNHRLIAVWIWNLLRGCLAHTWDLDSFEFQFAMSESAARQPFPDSHVAIHEALYHLGLMLSNPAIARQLESRLKSAMRRAGSIESLPVVFWPEHLSCAVVKRDLDQGIAVNRAYPDLYRAMAKAPDLVLAERASYHFTDRVLLPWFCVTGSL